MQLSDLYGDDPLELILLIMLLVYFPYAMYQLYLICYSLWMTDKDIMLKHKPLLEPNNVIVTVTTNGMATVYALIRPPDFKTFETIKKV